jgi:hypothetical protein
VNKARRQDINRLVLFIAVAFLGFIVGSAAMEFNFYPSVYLRNVWLGGRAFYGVMTEYRTTLRDVTSTDLWHLARAQSVGVTLYRQDKAYNGLTLFTSGHAQKAFLMGMDGRIVHEWSLPFSEIWDQSAAVRDPVPDNFIYWRKAKLFPNGDLLAVYIGSGSTPYGYGLVKVDKDSNLIWKYMRNVHHDVDVAEDGNIYTLTHIILPSSLPGYGDLQFPLLEDSLAVLSPDGQELKSISLLKAIERSEYKSILDRPEKPVGKRGDYLHSNSVDVIGRTLAGKFPFAEEGQVLISLRTLNMLVLLDVDSETIVWAATGPWLQQHDPDFLENGNILLFDNQGHSGPGGASRVIEFNPVTHKIEWNYTGTAAAPLQSVIRSAQQRLPNGNTLITESNNGRIIEVTPEGELVWEYRNTQRAGENDEFVAILSWGQRFDPDSLNFEFSMPQGRESTEN